LGSTELISRETKPKEVERVGAVRLGSYVDGRVRVDVGRIAESD